MSSLGIYLHIPFCRSRCSYCDFATGLYKEELVHRYVSSLATELSSSHGWSDGKVDTIYFGGGTPSLLNTSQLETILNAIHANFSVEPQAEVTMEMNPGTVNLTTLKEFRGLGINRASFGAQTFDDEALARLGRSHTTQETLATYESLRSAQFDNVSFDLIAGLPGQSLAQWKANVAQGLALRPEHLSFYLLEVHSGTPLADHIRRGIQPEPDDDLAGVMYEVMLEQSVRAGYEHYEISNLSLKGYESRHNTKYWTGEPYLGFGCSAHSYDGSRRRWSNDRDITRYLEAIEGGSPSMVEERELSDEDVRSEAVFLGLRLMKGFDTQKYREAFGVDLQEEHRDELTRFQEAGLIEIENDWLRLTRSGALLSNEVFTAFV